jgi:hypothetical protein
LDRHHFDRLSLWLVRSDSRRSALRALGAGVLATGLSSFGLGEALAKKKNRRTNCKKGCPECQKLKRNKCQCKPKPDGTPCFAGTCAGGVCLSPGAERGPAAAGLKEAR